MVCLPGRVLGLAGESVTVETAIGRFEGIEEPLARMGGKLYAMDAARSMTAGAIDLGEKPSVVSAIVKYHVTEGARQVVNDAMDILGGKGICLGPSNFLGRAYQQVPIGITVEGANILTRSLIIFGQGAIRCHPFVLKEMEATRHADRAQAVALIRLAVERGVTLFDTADAYGRFRLRLNEMWESLKIIEQSAVALFYMHSEGWIHCDVKPDNFLVSDEGGWLTGVNIQAGGGVVM